MENKVLCFKPMRNVHESGYRYIQYGYMTYDENNEEQIEIVGRYDVICDFGVLGSLHLDLTKSGWFRILPRRNEQLEWSYGGTIVTKGEI